MTKIIEFLNFGIFPGTVLFAHGMGYDELAATIRKNYKSKRWKDEHNFWEFAISGDKKLIDSGSHFALKRECENPKTGQTKTFYYLIIKRPFDFSDYDYCILAHEILHLCQFHLPDILNRDREIEAEAYLHTHLMQQALDIIRKC